jgi:LacI family transcriptional regulator
MVRNGTRQIENVWLPPLGIVERESTSGVASGDEHLREAVAFIRDHADQLITVEDVCGAIPLGRRALERRFRDHLGRTVLQEIHRAHIELAKTLLAETDWPVKQVAVEAGLSDVNHLLRLFKKQEGTTPGAYRRHLRLAAVSSR